MGDLMGKISYTLQAIKKLRNDLPYDTKLREHLTKRTGGQLFTISNQNKQILTVTEDENSTALVANPSHASAYSPQILKTLTKNTFHTKT